MNDRMFTAGCPTRDFDDVLALLRANQVTHLVDRPRHRGHEALTTPDVG